MKMPHLKTIGWAAALGLIGLAVGVGLGRWSLTRQSTPAGTDEPEASEAEDKQSDAAGRSVIQLTDAQQQEYGITSASCGPGVLNIERQFPGQIEFNADRHIRLCARVGGVVRRVLTALGDQVEAGAVLAIVQSQALAEARAAYLTTGERLNLSEARFKREQDLRNQATPITSEQDYQDAAAALAEARIARRTAEQALLTLGFHPDSLGRLADLAPETLGDYGVTAPFAGTIIDKQVTLGQAVDASSGLFTLADLDPVWVDLRVPAEDWPEVHPDQRVRIADATGQLTAECMLTYVAPLVTESSRTLLARGVLANPDGRWRPGLFISGRVTVADVRVPLLVPKTALQTLDDRTCVFVGTEEGFVPRFVTTGRADETAVEILAGLDPGQHVVTRGAFTLVAERDKETFGEDED